MVAHKGESALNVVPGTLGWLRSTNDRSSLGYLLERGPLTRQQIADLTGLSKPTAGQMMARLVAAGLIIERQGDTGGKRGPRAKEYVVLTEGNLGLAVVVDAGGMSAVLVDAVGTEYEPVTVPLPRLAQERSAPADVRRARTAVCTAAGIDEDAVRFVCVGVQASVDQRTGNLDLTSELPGWSRTGVAQTLEAELGMRAFVENDVKLAAAAEHAAGAQPDDLGFALLWLGEGLGLAVHFDGHVHGGAQGRAGEIGYLPIPHSAVGMVDRADTLQALMGGAEVARLARACGIKNRGFSALTPELVRTATEQERADFLDQLARRVTFGVIPALALFDPQRVVIGGPTGRLGGERLAELVRAEVRRTTPWNPEIVATVVADRPVLRGATQRLIGVIRQDFFDRVDALPD